MENVQAKYLFLSALQRIFLSCKDFENALWTNIEEYLKNDTKQEKSAQKSKKV